MTVSGRAPDGADPLPRRLLPGMVRPLRPAMCRRNQGNGVVGAGVTAGRRLPHGRAQPSGGRAAAPFSAGRTPPFPLPEGRRERRIASGAVRTCVRVVLFRGVSGHTPLARRECAVGCPGSSR
ncbi:hypothetical protein GCM10023238_03700 [Streptomyces heliomycini]